MFSLSFLPSYLLTRYAASLGQYAAASQSCNFALRFFHSNQKDVSETHWCYGFLVNDVVQNAPLPRIIGYMSRGTLIYCWQMPLG